MALTPTISPIGKLLGAVTLPPTPSGGRSFPEYKMAVETWTRKAQASIKQMASTLTSLDTSLIPSGGGGGEYWSQALFDTAFAGKTTDDLAEGATNLYWTTALFNTAFAAAFSAETTDSLPEGATHLYWSQALFNTAFAAALSVSSPLTFTSGILAIPQASTSVNGFLDSTDWNTFNTGATTAAAALPAAKQTKSIVLCSAYTPTATGGDTAEVEVPYSVSAGSLTFTVLRILFRVQTAGGAPSISIEQSSGTGAFSPTTVGAVTLTSGANEGQVTSGLGTITSGTKLRFNALTLASAQNWTVQVDISAN